MTALAWRQPTASSVDSLNVNGVASIAPTLCRLRAFCLSKSLLIDVLTRSASLETTPLPEKFPEVRASRRFRARDHSRPKPEKKLVEIKSQTATAMADMPSRASNQRQRFETGQLFSEFRNGRNLPVIEVSIQISVMTTHSTT